MLRLELLLCRKDRILFQCGPLFRKIGFVGQIAGEALKRITGTEIVYQQLAYLMRAGPPDSLDRMVAISYANLAVDLVYAAIDPRVRYG